MTYTKLVKDKIYYYFKNNGKWIVPKDLPFMKELLGDIESLCDVAMNDTRPRCSWCASLLNDSELFNNTCANCGKGPFTKEQEPLTVEPSDAAVLNLLKTHFTGKIDIALQRQRATLIGEVTNLVDKYWEFDKDQAPVSSWHDKQELLKAIESYRKS